MTGKPLNGHIRFWLEKTRHYRPRKRANQLGNRRLSDRLEIRHPEWLNDPRIVNTVPKAKNMKIRRLHTRIVIAFGLLLLVVQAVGLSLTNVVLSRSAHEDIRQSLRTGEGVFNLLREDNSRQLAQAASILSADFAFREAIATADHATMTSALVNHGARIHADVMMLVGIDNVLLADTSRHNRSGKPFPFPELVKEAEQRRQATAMVVLDGGLYQLVVVPVLAPLPIAWLALGFNIDDNFAKNLKSLTALEVSFATRPGLDGQWKLLATTMPANESAALPRVLADPANTAVAGTAELRMNGEDYVALISELNTQRDQIVVTVLQRSVQQALAPLRHLQVILLFLSGISIIAAIIAGNLMSRSITRPVSTLATLANRIEQGDYSRSAVVDRDDEIGRLASAFNHMSSGIAAREARITELAYRDPLTGLPNRTLFNDRLEQAIKAARRSGESFSVLMMDLDRFKDVNDILGHHVGDMLLQEVARRLVTVVMRDTDTVARLGGDEFAVLLPNSDSKGAEIIARKLLGILELPTLLEGQNVIASGSIGLAAFPQHGDEINTLLRHADLSMYEAKHHSSGYAIFDPSYQEQSHQHLSLMAELRHAVEHDELVLYYQPKIDLTSGTLSHVEALVRWMHPQRGMIPPNEFIPFAENTGYIRTITGWVIESALSQREKWRGQGLPLTISINISARDLLNAELPALFAERMKAHGASSHWLALEITESAIMGDPQRALGILDGLHDMGLQLSVDDFGTGYSSLAYLKKLPVSELKIDQSFVTHMENDKDDAIIVRSTIDLGHNMGLKVVAEGVENEATWHMLQAMGCDLAQGYYISRPLSAEALAQWIAQSSWNVLEEI